MKHLFLYVVCAAYLLCALHAVFMISNQPIRQVDNTSTQDNITFVLDAGHGGEDGGAVAADGTLEKDLNLQIEQTLAALFVLYGVPFIETRTEDASIGDNSLSTVRERKRSDILTRYRLVNETPNSVLLSIHQNKYEISKYSGAQVFYAADIPEAKAFAQLIQTSVRETLQPNNDRQIKPSGSSIFLLYKAQRPSVLIECGFLSNPDELARLKTPKYQTELSYAILRSVLQYCNAIKGEAAL